MPALAPIESADSKKDAVTQELAQLHHHTDDPRTRWGISTCSHKPCFGGPRAKERQVSPEETFAAPDQQKQQLYRSPTWMIRDAERPKSSWQWLSSALSGVCGSWAWLDSDHGEVTSQLACQGWQLPMTDLWRELDCFLSCELLSHFKSQCFSSLCCPSALHGCICTARAIAFLNLPLFETEMERIRQQCSSLFWFYNVLKDPLQTAIPPAVPKQEKWKHTWGM